MTRRSALRRTVAAVAAWLTVAAAPSNRAHPDALVGTYDGGHMEIAAQLELRADGRFRYGLSYGALDEAAEGSWSVEDGVVLLVSDPVVPPRFVLIERKRAANGMLSVDLEVPHGLSRQFFVVELADSSGSKHQLSDGPGPDEIPLGADASLVALTLPILDLRSDSVPLSGVPGTALRFRFEPDDFGRVAFAREPLGIEAGDLLLARHDGTIRFWSTR